MSIVAATDLHIRYRHIHAVNSVTFTVEPSEVVGLLGGNGAGKSSTLRAVAAVNPHTAGTLHVAGHDLSTPAGAEAARSCLGYCPDVGGLIGQATPREHIGIALALRQDTNQWPLALDLLHQFGLTDHLDEPTQGFSHGMCRRLSVVLAALAATDLLILDEPFDGVDPLGVQATMDVITRATQQGLGVLISTHLMSLLTQISNRVLVMVEGRVVDTAPANVFTGPTGQDRYESLLRRETPTTPTALDPTAPDTAPTR